MSSLCLLWMDTTLRALSDLVEHPGTSSAGRSQDVVPLDISAIVPG
jgi:hypothetical protein